MYIGYLMVIGKNTNNTEVQLSVKQAIIYNTYLL